MSAKLCGIGIFEKWEIDKLTVYEDYEKIWTTLKALNPTMTKIPLQLHFTYTYGDVSIST